MERIKLKDIFGEPNPAEIGFKNKEDYENKRQENIKMWKRRGTYNIMIKTLIIIFEFIFLYNIDNGGGSSDSYLLFIIFIDAILFQIITIIIDEIFYPRYEKEINMYMEVVHDYNLISNISEYEINGYYDKIIENEKEQNRFLRPSLNDDITKDAIAIVLMKERRNIKHELILKAIDEMLVPNCKEFFEIELSLVLSWLVGLNVISKDEANERDCYKMNLIENISSTAYCIITSGDKILLKKENGDEYSLLSIYKQNEDKSISAELIKEIEREFDEKNLKLKFVEDYRVDMNGNILNEEEYNKIVKSGNWRSLRYFVVYRIEFETDKSPKNRKYKWYNIENLKKDKLNPYTYEILCDADIID